MRSVLLAATLFAAFPAAATTIFSQNFDAPDFVGYTFDPGDSSDRFGPTDYSYINDSAGWSFSSDATFLAQHSGTSDGAVLLNENGSGGQAYVTVGGLTAGRSYALGFLLSGDNEPGMPYQLTVAIDGSLSSFSGTDGDPASTAGVVERVTFVAQGSSAAIAFTQLDLGAGASPMIDDVTVDTVPEPAAWALMLAGFAAVGTAARTRRTRARA